MVNKKFTTPTIIVINKALSISLVHPCIVFDEGFDDLKATHWVRWMCAINNAFQRVEQCRFPVCVQEVDITIVTNQNPINCL